MTIHTRQLQQYTQDNYNNTHKTTNNSTHKTTNSNTHTVQQIHIRWQQYTHTVQQIHIRWQQCTSYIMTSLKGLLTVCMVEIQRHVLFPSFSVFQSKRILLVAHIILSSPNFAFLWMSAWSFPLFTGTVSVCKRRKTATGVTFIGPCVANILAKYNQQDATFHNLFISVRRSTCFRRGFRPSSGAQKCKYSVRYLSDR